MWRYDSDKTTPKHLKDIKVAAAQLSVTGRVTNGSVASGSTHLLDA
jgi:hypothetical protein